VSPPASPEARFYHTMAYNAALRKVVLFGGYSPNLQDTWFWDGSVWVRESLNPHPAGRYLHAMAYDAARGQVVLFGGTDNGCCWPPPYHFSETWVSLSPDSTPPTMNCSATPNRLWPVNKKMVPISVSVVVTDGGSGPGGFKLLSATSNEPDAGAIQGFIVGTPSVSGSLKADRLGTGSGRVYSLTYQGSDNAGNTALCVATVTVPHDQGK
jgi:hypothetical protein